MRIKRVYFLVAFALVISTLAAIMPSAFAGAVYSPRFMRGDQWTVNGLTTYKLGTSESNIQQYNGRSIAGLYSTVSYGIRVWTRTSGGVEYEVTSGTPEGVASVATDSQYHSIIGYYYPWPASMSPSDAIVVRVYVGFPTGEWKLEATFITEQLGATALTINTWWVYYYVYAYTTRPNGGGYHATTTGRYYWGAPRQSVIDGFVIWV